MDTQPLLPVREEPRSLEYFPMGEDGDIWSVRDWPGLKETFALEPHELEAWHRDVAGQDRAWKVVKRIYGVMAVFGDAVEEEDAEEWTWPALARREGVPEKTLREDLAALVDFWTKLRVSRRLPAGGEVGGPGRSALPGERSGIGGPRQKMAEDQISAVLEEYRFEHLKGRDRTFVARRISEMRSLFEDKNRRESARQLLVMELHLQYSEKTGTLLRERLEALSNKSDKTELTEKDSGEIRAIQESLKSQEQAHTKLTKDYLAAAERLGGEEIEQGELRKAALGTAGYFIDSVRDYYQSGDRALIDGVFTAEELVWLTTPHTMRPAQYRPDLVIAINDCLQPYNLFDPDYRPPSIPREASRRMLRLARQLTEEEDTPVIPEIDDAPGDGDDESEVTAADDPELSDPPEPAAIPDPPRPLEVREEDFMAM